MSRADRLHWLHRPARWTLLTQHAVVVAALSVAALVLLAVGLEDLASIAVSFLSPLGLPWAAVFVFRFAPLPWETMGPLGYAMVAILPAVLNVVLHRGVVALVREHRRQRAGAATAGGVGPASRAEPGAGGRPWILPGSCALVGAAIWGAWLGWDTTYYEIAGAPGLHGPYTPAQVAGCALTVGVATILLAWRWNPPVVAGGITAGFWLVWTLWAALGP